MIRCPLGVSIDMRPRYAPDLVSLYTGDAWIDALAAALRQLEVYGEAGPMLVLPDGHDPAAYRWPVPSRNVAIYGCLPCPRLLRLMAALLRDGAAVAAGLDTGKEVHIAHRKAKAAA